MTHNWKIYNLKRTLANNVVTKVTYACESEFSGSSTRKIGEFTISGDPSDADFIAYDSLTEADVLGWVDDNVAKSTIETENSASIAQRIVARAARTEAQGTPW